MQYNFSYIRISGLIFLHFERFEDLVSENVELSYICAYMLAHRIFYNNIRNNLFFYIFSFNVQKPTVIQLQ